MPPPPSAFADVLILTGPTGSGKSAVALELAERLGGEIVSADSMTIYRGMDVGTAKPTAAERARVPHHLIDVLDPWESGNVAWWLDAAAAACEVIQNRGRRPLVVGGTPFYLRAILSGLFDAPPSDPEIRARLEADAATAGTERFHGRLAEIDPVAAKRLHPNDVRRVVRALEVWELTGRPISSFQQSWDTPAFTGGNSATPARAIPTVVLEWPRDELYRRIDARVDQMLAAGWPAEVRNLRGHARPLSKEAAQALGYRDLIAHLEGDGTSWESVVDRIKTRTRQYAKRQLTWFRHLPGLVPVATQGTDLPQRVRTAWRV
ncbi:MAG: tRNA (adenosine(37)-N6)-dimethylallyltransferase MiaA [Fimbriiglobus sp.]